jgi:glutaredoxin
MSEERRKRQQERVEGKSMAAMRNVIILVLIVAAFAATYYLGRRRRAHRLDAFAQCLTAKQVKMYGLYWCTHCEEQKEIFGSAVQQVPYVECGIKGSHTEEPVCVQAGVTHFPTWQFNGERHEGVLSLQALSEKSGCGLP